MRDTQIIRTDPGYILNYLKSRKILNNHHITSIELLEDGYMCYVYKIGIKNQQPCYMKLFRKYAKGDESLLLDPRTYQNELAAYSVLKDYEVKVNIPKILFVDDENRFFILTQALSGDDVSTFGEFCEEYKNRSSDVIYNIGRELNSLHTTMRGKPELKDRISPPYTSLLEWLLRDLSFLSDDASSAVEFCMKTPQSMLTMVHGDISFDNIIVTKNRISFIDWSNSAYAMPEIDVGMMIGRMMVKSIEGTWHSNYANMFNQFMTGYCDSFMWPKGSHFDDRSLKVINTIAAGWLYKRIVAKNGYFDNYTTRTHQVINALTSSTNYQAITSYFLQ